MTACFCACPSALTCESGASKGGSGAGTALRSHPVTTNGPPSAVFDAGAMGARQLSRQSPSHSGRNKRVNRVRRLANLPPAYGSPMPLVRFQEQLVEESFLDDHENEDRMPDFLESDGTGIRADAYRVDASDSSRREPSGVIAACCA